MQLCFIFSQLTVFRFGYIPLLIFFFCLLPGASVTVNAKTHRPSPNNECNLLVSSIIALTWNHWREEAWSRGLNGEQRAKKLLGFILGALSSSLCGPGLLLEAPIQPTIAALCSCWDTEQPTEFSGKPTDYMCLCLGLNLPVSSVLVSVCWVYRIPRMKKIRIHMKNRGEYTCVWVSRCHL